ncbi:electron transfer flavoprotein subunit alpha/FixB family protein [Azoarcus olearius]|uniref:Electron transfer flavoprotein subunit alpha n=1 Tax=Azoarcus sp. (strain BH72) TaxID=418699 RepID=A1K9W7_AZOSB|nr:FAD-binding protein [Azoarcus olearius]CAL95622.1 probable electron transfer flavoprotein, alpha subunit [Azoarcus olearius]
MNALIIAAHDGQQLDPATACAVTAARPLAANGRIDILVVGHDTAAVAAQAAALVGVASVRVADSPALGAPNAETLARQITAVAAGYAWVLAAHNLQARAALPRAAALAGAAYLSDVVRTAADALERPAYAGAVVTRVRPLAAATFLTVRASAFPAAAAASAPAPIEAVAAVEADARTRILGSEGGASTRPDLSRARIVVAGGRGVGSAENMAKVEALADHLGAAVGASRAAVDAGFAPNAVQIGQTGKVVAPDLYLALGISGAIQHLAGIKDAKCIVAINKDPDAPIFQIADYGIVGDLFEALPVLQAQLAAAAA